MNPKYLTLYLIATTLAILLAIYQVVRTYPVLDTQKIVLNILTALFFGYLAYKTYHEKKDQELM